MTTLSERSTDFCFFDFETRARAGSGANGDLIEAGAYRYAANSFPIILTYVIGDGPVKCVALDDGFDESYLDLVEDTHKVRAKSLPLPDDLHAFYHRATKGEAWFVAWNTAFDRAVWNNWMPSRPLAPEMTIDTMCQALASNLPADLQSASTVLLGGGKQEDGAKLIKLFSPAYGATPQTHPDEWARFKTYAERDTEVLRADHQATRPLTKREWQQYWASERINERGVAVDVAFCKKAAKLAEASVDWANRQLLVLTGVPTLKVSTPRQIARWVYDRLEDPEAWALLEKELPDEDETEDEEIEVEQKPAELRLTRSHIVRLRALLALKKARNGGLSQIEQDIDTVLELREYGGAASISKFAKMVAQADSGRLKGSYVFNGAMQTGRFSSRGVQVHNLPRDSLGDLEETAMADIMDMQGSPGFDRYVDRFAKDYGSPGRALSRLIRPALVAPKGKVLVWADWRNIEARVNPWLSLSRSGVEKLDVFRHSDAHPDEPDVYRHTAADLIGCNPHDVTKPQRQSHGKVPELSLGFGGGKDALLRMAAVYGVAVGEEQAQDMVNRWREVNPWARGFWNKLWEAIGNALDNHGLIYEAGRVSYVFKPDYLGGTLFCALPCGRLLSYPQCRWEDVEVTDRKTGDKQVRQQLTYRKGHGRAALWYGKACENVVQATAGSLLRSKLTGLPQVVLHTHDDICMEVDEDEVEAMKTLLSDIMRRPTKWSDGLPLAVDVTSNWFFTKAGD